MIQTKVCSSLVRISPDGFAAVSAQNELSALRNEPLSFQLAYQLSGAPWEKAAFYTRVETDLPLKMYAVEYVPLIHAGIASEAEHLAQPGLIGDALTEKQINPPITECSYPWQTMHVERGETRQLVAYGDCCQALWFTVNPAEKRLAPGTHTIRLQLFSRADQSLLAEETVSVTLMDALLPRQSLLCTNWFYVDCLCDFYGVAPYSDRFYEIFQSFVSTAAEHGMNMLLLPAFTPPLDTPIESHRMNVQLVRITVENGSYTFDFTEMERYIRTAMACGITHFEHAHLFTQWGATGAPDIYATVNGKEKRIFDYKTKASGASYKKFLCAYLPAVRAFLRTLGLEKKTLFHISDEPTDAMLATYTAAKEAVGDLLDGCLCGDTLSHYALYEKGLVQQPIVATDAIQDFVGKCDPLWCYYTGGQTQNGLSNRTMPIPPERNRMLGIQMYAARIAGFLHWGYNFYYGVLSYGQFHPLLNPCGYGADGGTCFLVYPGSDGRALPSVRQKIFAEAILDYRALQRYEKSFGRAAADALLQDCFGTIDFHTTASAAAILAFRTRLNRELDRK